MVSPVVGALALKAIAFFVKKIKALKKYDGDVRYVIGTTKLLGANTKVLEGFWSQVLKAEEKAVVWEKRVGKAQGDSIRVFDRVRVAAHNRQPLELNEGEVAYLDLLLRGVRWMKKKTR